MARRRKEYRVLGPYRHGRRWRVLLVGPGNFREVVSCATEDEASRAIREAWKRIPGLTSLEIVLDQYERFLEAKGNKKKSVKETMRRLRHWHDPEAPVYEVTQRQLAQLYEERCLEVAVDSHRNELAEVKTFWRWVVAKKLASRSPAEEIQPVGTRRRGKKQLYRNEAQKLFAQALMEAHAGAESAIAVLAVLLLGLRSSEIHSRRVRDVDVGTDGQVWLWIEHGKTKAATRRFQLYPPLSELLAKQAGNRSPQEWLFPSDRSESGHRGVTWLRRNAKRICKAAGVPEVCPHGMRGTWSTLATEVGTASAQVTRELGHTRERVTRQHYLAPGAAEQAKSREVLRVIKGGQDA